MNQLITRFNFKGAYLELRKSKRVFFCGPGITREIAEVLIQLAKGNVDCLLYLVCDLDEQNDYRGLNEIEELNKLFLLPNVVIKNSKGINVSFITNFTDFNFYLFPVSKILKDEPGGYNAASFNGLTGTTLFGQFFPEIVSSAPANFLKIIKLQKEAIFNKLSDEFEDDDTVENILGDKLDVALITEKEIKSIQKKVKEFPPEKPDLQRIVNFISTYIQVVDLKFEGANWQGRTVTIPKKLIPFKSEILRKNLDSKLKIFTQDDENESLKKFNELKKKVEDLRKEFLFRSKLRKKSIIKINEKSQFKIKVDELHKEVETFKDSLFTLVKAQILLSKERIKSELVDFYIENPDDDMKKYKGNFEGMVRDEVDGKTGKIKFPTVNEIVGELGLTISFLNFTYEDFEDEKFLEELAGWDKLTREEYFKLFDKQKAFGTINKQ